MRIAVSSQGTDLTSSVDPRFARAPYFLIFDTSDESVEVVNNDQSVQAAHGAGVQAAQIVADKKVDIVISGNFGPTAFATLSAAGIKTATWAEGKVSQAIELARNDQLKPADSANVKGHWA